MLMRLGFFMGKRKLSRSRWLPVGLTEGPQCARHRFLLAFSPFAFRLRRCIFGDVTMALD
jgi:hypothetical protein